MNIELFGCSGGMAAGFLKAGIEFDFVVDRDPDACASYKANLGHQPVQGDVYDFYSGTLGFVPENATDAHLAGFSCRGKDVDLIVADPPCKPWSTAGKRLGLADPNDCMAVTVNIICALRPRTYLIGNVPGLGGVANLAVQRQILTPLLAVGYCTADFQRLDAVNYGVPQFRKRPFWFGHLTGPCLTWPAPTNCDPKQLCTGTLPGLRRLEPWITCRQALSHLPQKAWGSPVILRWAADSDHRASTIDEPAKTQTTNPNSDGCLVVTNAHPPSYLDQPANVVCAKDYGGPSCLSLSTNSKHPACFPDEPSHTIRNHSDDKQSAVLVWPYNRPSPTITTKEFIGGAGRPHRGPRGSGQWGVHAIKLSLEARLRLQAFPPGWVIVGETKKSRSNQVGMAMPPPLAAAVAQAVAAQMRTQ